MSSDDEGREERADEEDEWEPSLPLGLDAGRAPLRRQTDVRKQAANTRAIIDEECCIPLLVILCDKEPGKYAKKIK